jgi:hypothetical protein
MSPQSAPSTATVETSHESSVPMIAIALGQIIISFNVASLPVALSGMVNSIGVPLTTVAAGTVAYSMLAIIPAGRLPNYLPAEAPADPAPEKARGDLK